MGKPNLLTAYDAGANFCETTDKSVGGKSNALSKRLSQYNLRTLNKRNSAAERELRNLGITFTVYSDAGAIDRILPFDPLPRMISAEDWNIINTGCIQRVTALNEFLKDIYGKQKILSDGVVPKELVVKNKNFRKEVLGLKLAQDTYTHISGVDLIRDENGEFLVLEDNCRSPSGVSYVIENRHLMMRSFPDLLEGIKIRPVSDYGQQLRRKLSETAPPRVQNPNVVLLTPGVFNSAYFEHVFLAREMGAALVEGRDLVVDDDDRVFMKTISGLERVHVIYRRIDDDFLDPEVFREDSMLGTPGLMRALKAGKVTIANAIGAGVADDKAVYAYMPKIIDYYLGEDPVINNVETYICREKDDLAYVLDHLEELVVKPVGESGGYGIVVGPKATKKEINDVRRAIKKDPSNYIAQPMISLSVCPTLTKNGLAPRHVDLRPYVLTGKDSWVLPGGLTRVAMREGSIIVNSSQGGGSKDTWVLRK
ncbi:MAG: circularly permuted type 2 ATP-grasp protein [Marinicaulis sp.]|nr:circularly permuted type 2 ATP-grasp protein [Marinicaulis sp.]NNL87876.1 circularly permuted type 2 ATP-grasp protein [Marinicaulis sp.]